MRSMRVRCTGAPRFSWLVVAAVCLSGCGGVFGPTYEYEEDLSLSLDGSAAVNVSASVAALVALRGADLDADPGAEIDRESVQRFSRARARPRAFDSPGGTAGPSFASASRWMT